MCFIGTESVSETEISITVPSQSSIETSMGIEIFTSGEASTSEISSTGTSSMPITEQSTKRG